MRLIGVTRHPDRAPAAALGVTHCYAFHERLTAFAEADVLVLCLPMTADTHGIVDIAAFAALAGGRVTDRSYAGITDAVIENIERLRRGEPPADRAA